MNMGKKITDLSEGSAIPGESRYPVSMGDGTGVKQVKHSTLVGQLLSDMELPYDETMALLTGTEADEDEDGEENGKQKIPNLQAISDWIMSKIVNNLLATEEGFFMDARIGPVLDQRITANTNAITQINSDLVYKPGDIISNNAAIWIAGVLTSGRNNIMATITLQKPINDNFSFSLVSLSVRQNGVYLVDNYGANEIEQAGITTNAYLNGAGGFTLLINKPDGWGGINNETVLLTIGFKITIS